MAATCGCKGIRSCFACEENGLKPLKETISRNSASSTICTVCLSDFPAWDVDFALSSSDLHQLHCVDNRNKKIVGIYVVDNFITPQEEDSLLLAVDKGDLWQVSQSGRRKQDFGPKVNFKKRRVRIGNFRGLPEFCRFLVERLRATVEPLKDFQPVEMCFLEYDPSRGSSIDPHRDDSWLWGDRLVTCNLGADSVLTLSRCSDETLFRVPMRRLSLLVLSGEARDTWDHGILREDVVGRRVAITWRELSRLFQPGGQMEVEGAGLLEVAGQYY